MEFFQRLNLHLKKKVNIELRTTTSLLIFQTIFGLILLAIWFFLVDLNSIFRYFQRLDGSLIVLALIFGMGATTLRIVRWKLILNPLCRIPFLSLLSLGYIQALVNYFIPIRAGEIGITYLIKKKYKLPFAKVLAVTFLNRAFDLLAGFTVACGFSLILTLTDPKYLNLFLFMSFLLIGSLVIFYFLLFQKHLVLRLISRIGRFLPSFRGRGRLSSLLNDFVSGVFLLRSTNSSSLITAVLSLLALLLDGAYLYLIFLAFGLKVSFMLVTFGMVLFTLSYLIPAAPLYIGTTELTGALIFTFILGISTNAASSVVVFWHLLNTLLIISLGFAALWLYRTKKT